VIPLEQQADAILAARRGQVDAPALAAMRAAIATVLAGQPVPGLRDDAATATRLLREAEDRARANLGNG
jgi:hypothetical protein